MSKTGNYGFIILTVSTKEAFSSLDMLKYSPIVLGDESLTDSLGKGRIDIDHGKFNNVFYCNIPNPSTNEEDATICQIIRASSPMNMNMHTYSAEA